MNLTIKEAIVQNLSVNFEIVSEEEELSNNDTKHNNSKKKKKKKEKQEKKKKKNNNNKVSVQFSSDPSPVRSTRGHDGQLSRNHLPFFFCEIPLSAVLAREGVSTL